DLAPRPHPETLFTIAAVSLKLARFRGCLIAAERCATRAEETGSDRLLLRARITEGLAKARMGPESQTELDLDELDRLQQRHGDSTTLLDLERLKIIVLSDRSDQASLNEAVRLGEETALRFAAKGDRRAGAELLRQIATGPILDLGRYGHMVRLEERAASLSVEHTPSERSLALRCLAGALAGDYRMHVQAANNFESLYGSNATSWIEAYVWGARMITSSLLGSNDGVSHAYGRYRGLIGELSETPTGRFWECCAAGAFALINRRAEAETCLKRAEAGNSFIQRSLAMATLIVAARTGTLGETLDLRRQLDAEDLLTPELAWRADLELLVARSRDGEPVGDELLPLLDTASELGLARLAELLTRSLAEESAQRGQTTAISIFGEFAVTLPDGSTMPTAAGKPVELIKLLSLRGGSIHVDMAIDALWPDTDADAGRKRLKNVLNRARSMLGPDAIDRTGDVLNLGPSVRTDIQRFRELAARCASASPGSTDFTKSAGTALDIARRGLLPGDRYADWAANDRWHFECTVRRLVVAMVEVADTEAELAATLELLQKIDIDDDLHPFEKIADKAEQDGFDHLAALARSTIDRLLDGG
ncbi:MAG: hypothetical protein OEO77_15535, partial [Acidimicrobiia bacterium]|nr:hypothetical protein [Acidimicrobiia bacterium]